MATWRAGTVGTAVALVVWASAVPREVDAGNGTRWDVRTSQGFDALCALNVLSGDDYYVQQYPEEAREFGVARYDAARREARALKLEIKDRQGGIVSAFLTLAFSGGPDSTLDAVLASARDTSRLRSALHDSPFWSQESWDLFQRVRRQPHNGIGPDKPPGGGR